MNPRETLEAILQSFEPYPNMRIMLFSRDWGELEEELGSFVNEGGHSLLLYQTQSFTPPEREYLKVKSYKPTQPRYNLQGRLYNYIFIHHLPESLELLSKKIFSSIQNGGRIYLLSDLSSFWEESEILERVGYVSINEIDLDRKRGYTTAKKMHGWGDNGKG